MSWYHSWHNHRFHPHVHWGTFLLTCFLATSYLLGAINLSYADTTTGLVAHYKFDEGSGTTALDSTGNNTGTLTNGPTWATGKVGGALSFDDANDIVKGAMLENLGSGMTVTGWINPTGDGVLVNRGSSASPGRWNAQLAFNNRIQFTKDGSTDLFARSSPIFALGQWQHFAITWDGSANAANVLIYRNGALVSKDLNTNGVGLLSDSNLDFSLGAQITSNFYGGLLDEVRIYNRVLSTSDITELYNFGGDTPPAYITPYTTPYTTPDSNTSQTIGIINAASCSQADVQAAINTAVDGNTVMVPAGTCTWTSPVFIGYQYDLTTYPAKSIILKGAGIDQTIILDRRVDGPAWPSGGVPPVILSVYAAANKPVRISGFSFDGSGTMISQAPIQVIGLLGAIVRIDHSKFFNLAMGGITISGAGYGVIDHNTFVKPTGSGPVTGIKVSADGDAAWNRPLGLGTENAVYMEDNTFDFSSPPNGAIDTYNGSRFVFRYNNVKNTWTGNHGFDSGGFRSGLSYEIYNNTFDSSVPASLVFESRGGTGVLFNNTITGSYGTFAQLRNYRSSDYYPISYGAPFPWNGITPPNGICDGTHSNDGNTIGMQGYPCKDQIGRTTGQLLSPVYAWNNNFKGNIGGNAIASGYGSTALPLGGTDRYSIHIVQGRDFYNIPKPGYTPYPYPHPLTTSGFLADSDSITPPSYLTPYPTPYTYPTPSESETGDDEPANTTYLSGIPTTGAEIGVNTLTEEAKQALIIQIMLKIIDLLTQLIAKLKSGAAAAITAFSSWSL